MDRARGALDYSGRDADRDIGQEFDQYGAAGSLEDRIYNQGRGNRGEYRDEREFQVNRGQRSLDNAVRQRELENMERDQAFRRSMGQVSAGGG